VIPQVVAAASMTALIPSLLVFTISVNCYM
jgi:hypothetical protein